MVNLRAGAAQPLGTRVVAPNHGAHSKSLSE
jgi:hypothetical protein